MRYCLKTDIPGTSTDKFILTTDLLVMRFGLNPFSLNDQLCDFIHCIKKNTNDRPPENGTQIPGALALSHVYKFNSLFF